MTKQTNKQPSDHAGLVRLSVSSAPQRRLEFERKEVTNMTNQDYPHVLSQQELAICGAPAGGCGFRGRDWRKGQRVAHYSSFDGTPTCLCGSEMRPFHPRRFITYTAR